MLPSTMAVQLIHLLATGLHGDGHPNPTTTRRHARHLSPSIQSGIVTFNAVQEGIAIIATCRKRIPAINVANFIQCSGPNVPVLRKNVPFEDVCYGLASQMSKKSQKLHSSKYGASSPFLTTCYSSQGVLNGVGSCAPGTLVLVA